MSSPPQRCRTETSFLGGTGLKETWLRESDRYISTVKEPKVTRRINIGTPKVQRCWLFEAAATGALFISFKNYNKPNAETTNGSSWTSGSVIMPMPVLGCTKSDPERVRTRASGHAVWSPRAEPARYPPLGLRRLRPPRKRGGRISGGI